MGEMRAHIAVTRAAHIVVMVDKVRKGVPMPVANKIAMAQRALRRNMNLHVEGMVEGGGMRKMKAGGGK